MGENLLETIRGDLLAALKSGDQPKVGALRFLLSAIHNAEISKGKDAVLTEEELIEVLRKQARQRCESIEAYEKGGRSDLVEQERRELEIVGGYLPRMLSEEEIRPLIEETIKEVGAKGSSDMGKVMGALMPKVKGKADGAVVSKIVKEMLAS